MDDLPDEVPSPKDSLRGWREQILDWFLKGLAFFSLFAVIVGVTVRLEEGRSEYVALYLCLYAVILLATLVRRLGFVPRALVLFGVLYVFAATGSFWPDSPAMRRFFSSPRSR